MHSLTPLHLRPATRGDAARIATWATTEDDVLLFAGPLLAHPLTPQALLDTARDGWQVLALIEESTPVATLSLRPDGAGVRIGRILVDPAHRGQGLGRTLVEHAVERAIREHNAPFVTLGVYSHNTAARFLYERLGFNITSHGEPLPNGWASIQMRKDLAIHSRSAR